MLLGNARNPGVRLGLAALGPAWQPADQHAREQARELLEVFGLSAKAGDYAGTLSGGQRKLLDEPLAGVNRTLGRSLLEHIENLRVQRRLTILLVEHDMDVVMRHSDHVVVMAEGRVVAAGTPAEVRSDERVIAAYLGSAPAAPGSSAD
jgi:neutral amino acid transport system ATP-binding protein